jgi:predicted NBD/HSP70 family sugar kinase
VKQPDRIPGTPRLLRAINDRSALQLLLEHGRLSRTELGSLTGLSKPTASQLLSRLEAAGLVISVGGAVSNGPGRAAQLYEVNPAAGHVAAFDVTPGTIRAVVVDLGGRAVAEIHSSRPRRERDALDHLSEAYAQVLTEAGLTRADISHAVVGVPGAYDLNAGTLRHARHLPGWHQPDLHQHIAKLLGVTVELENDVNLVALAEHDTGAAAAVDTSILLWSADGLGAAVVIDGRLHRGSTGSAGEVAYLPIAGQPLVRNAARNTTGGFQRAAGGPAILQLGRSLGLHGVNPVNMVRSALSATGGEAFLDELATRYATGLAAMITVIDPELVILSGPVLQAGGEDLRARIEREIGSLAMQATPAKLGRMNVDPVLAGAKHVAVSRLREAVFRNPGADPPTTRPTHHT